MAESAADREGPERAKVKIAAGVAILLAVTVIAIIAAWLVGPVQQPQSYHDFADTRTIAGIPHFMNVLSNAGFLIVGLIGLVAVIKDRKTLFVDAREYVGYAVLFAGIVLTALGSSWYHLGPSNASLLWDRLPMTLIFASFVSVTIAERISVRTGLISLAPLVLAGASTVIYWYATESAGSGDLRPYILMQFYPMIAIPLMMWLFSPRYTGSWQLAAVIVIYGFARVPEMYDRQVYDLLGCVSGHTVKHIVAAIALIPVITMIRSRKPSTQGRE